jgi:hypothetical protein
VSSRAEYQRLDDILASHQGNAEPPDPQVSRRGRDQIVGVVDAHLPPLEAAAREIRKDLPSASFRQWSRPCVRLNV